MIAAALIFAYSVGTPFFPEAPGTAWTYELTVLGQRGTLVQRVSANHGGKLSLAMTATLGKQTTTSAEELQVLGGTIARTRGAVGLLSPALPLFSGAPGSWEWQGTATLGGVSRKAWASVEVDSPAQISVPVGRFSAHRIRVAMTIEADGKRVTLPTTYWFAKGVGWVKVQAELPAGTVDLNLKEFKPFG